MKLYLMYALFWSILLSGCATESKFIKTANNHPEWSEKLCADKYPVQTKYVQGRSDTVTKSEIRTDTVTVEVQIPGEGVKTVRVPCPPCEGKTRTIYRTDTITVETAKVKVLERKLNTKSDELDKSQAELKQVKSERKKAIITGIGLFIALLGCGYLLIRK